ncbi:MAG: peroxiredoxin family protein [Planctomycetaceae bacterium]|jgi:peroxiredoxin
MKPRFLILLVLLSAVVAATTWRLVDPPAGQIASVSRILSGPAPDFQLLDQNNRPVRLQGYISRFRVLLAFFDGQTGPDADPVMQSLKQFSSALRKNNIRILAVSTPLGPQLKPQTLSYPFPVLRDTIAGTPESCSVRWGVCQQPPAPNTAARITPALFLISQDGLVQLNGQLPEALPEPLQTISKLVQGD